MCDQTNSVESRTLLGDVGVGDGGGDGWGVTTLEKRWHLSKHSVTYAEPNKH